jgi:tetratricopeptide (TPR) repeat protein
MFVRRAKSFALLAGALGAGPVWADHQADLADLGARVEYGFYTQEQGVIAAARAGLERLPDAVARVNYHRALAALRFAQVQAERRQPVGPALADCVESAEDAAAQEPAWSEPWVLLGACAALGTWAEPMKALLHARRYEQAVGRARGLEPENPHIALIATWRALADSGKLDVAADTTLLATLETAVVAYQAPRRTNSGEEWGEAETLALLGALYLQRGELRSARDVIERALLAAPGYVEAIKLRGELEPHVGTSRLEVARP